MFTFQINHNEAVEKILQPHKGNQANVPKSFQRHIFGEKTCSPPNWWNSSWQQLPPQQLVHEDNAKGDVACFE